MFFLNRTRDLYHSDDIFSMSFSPSYVKHSRKHTFLVIFSKIL